MLNNHRIKPLQSYFVTPLIILLTACSTADSQPFSASVGIITTSVGFPRVVRKNQMYILAPQARIYQGDVIETDSSSAIKVDMIDDTTFDLGPASHFVLHSYPYSVNGKSNTARMSLTSGSLRTSTVNTATSRRTSFEIKTRLATIEIENADCWSGYIPGANTLDVVMLEGSKIKLRNGHGSIQITTAGYGTTVFGDSAPQSPQQWPQSKLDRSIFAY